MLLLKKPEAAKCSNFCIVSLIASTAKIIAVVFRRRIDRKIEDVLGEDQLRFRRGKGAKYTVGMLRIISERTVEVIEELYACFIDWQKALDHGKWTNFMQCPKSIGIDWR
jgi:hypothetical protein